jgi:uncharacterized membrane protein YsdA (DUF1294 family)
MEYLLLLYALASVVCFVMYAIDKRAAGAGRRRISERALLWTGLAFGWPGALLAQRWLRHKSSKASFLWLFWATVLLNVTIVAALIYLTLYVSEHVAIS